MPEGDTGIWCDKNKNYFQNVEDVCVCLYVYESLGKSLHIFLCVCVCVCERLFVSVFVCSVSNAAPLGSPQCA